MNVFFGGLFPVYLVLILNMLFWIFFALALISASLIAVVILKRWKEIRLLDTDTIRAEQDRRARDRIVRERFDRLLRHWSAPIRHSAKRAARNVTVGFQRMENRLKVAAGMETNEGDGSSENPGKIVRLIEEARAEAREGNVAKAERLYLEILKMNMRHFDAYRGLGSLYLSDRQYRQAKETYDFLLSIGGANDEVYANLGHIADVEGKNDEAEAMFAKSLEVAPDSALRHSEVAEFYGKRGKSKEAWIHAKRASELDPDNLACLELSARTAIIVRDREEAEKRYEELRLRGYDRLKLHQLKDRLDAMEDDAGKEANEL